jgi:hypothetical protein
MVKSGIIFILLGAGCSTGLAQMAPPARTIQKINDPGMVINDRGAKLEVLPTRRATPQLSSAGDRIVHSIFTADNSTPIGPKELGVVFNHSMQAQGYITGEIAFKMKNGLQATDWLDAASYPGLAKLTAPNVYLVVAQTPSEFVQLVKRLQSRTDMEWVEPVVTYGSVQAAPDPR